MSVRAMLSIAVALGLLYLSFTVGAPFLLALIVAIFLEPLNKLFMTKLRMPRLVAAIISCTLFTVGLLGLMFLIGLKVLNEVIAFVEKLPRYFSNLSGMTDDLLGQLRKSYENLPPEVVESLEKYMTTIIDWLTKAAMGLSGKLGSALSALPSMFIFFIVFIVAVYMLSFGLHTLKQSVISFFHEESHDKVTTVLDSLKVSIFGFLRSQIILSAMTYVLSLVGLLILDIKYPLAIALLIIIVDILPILGTGSVLVPWAIYCLFVGDIFTAIGLVLLFVVITVFRRTVEPKILGDAVGIGALSVLISLYVGLELVGVIGVFLGPLVVIIYSACKKAGIIPSSIKL
ncbi:sporulation integral membrane protein YtvI [Paenibacillus endoradicis]|uniref:sporulation integral membrane protein YtvI n=1 Tax=Paenibacillus endoradicis TaxID=2972487 RepID=UPI002159B15A|nr:sporulation integral membrane protein YtvI [Paenibacillus endoradicis]MCR8659019.1 sporulation integral membrane protein YtvI [Paenibacillus endoradicis]